MDGISFSTVRLAVLLLLSVAGVGLRPAQLHAQDKTRGEELSADETLNYLRQKLDAYGTPPPFTSQHCTTPYQSLQISSDRHFIVFTVCEDWHRLTDGTVNPCGFLVRNIQVQGLKAGGRKPGRWKVDNTLPNSISRHYADGDVETGDWTENSTSVAVLFACKGWACVNSPYGIDDARPGERHIFASSSSYWQNRDYIDLNFYNAPEEQIERISRAMAHLVEALQKEPANLQQDKNDPFAK
jgi:hypothetical protein